MGYVAGSHIDKLCRTRHGDDNESEVGQDVGATEAPAEPSRAYDVSREPRGLDTWVHSDGMTARWGTT